jgi:hypothetical protein
MVKTSTEPRSHFKIQYCCSILNFAIYTHMQARDNNLKFVRLYWTLFCLTVNVTCHYLQQSMDHCVTRRCRNAERVPLLIHHGDTVCWDARDRLALNGASTTQQAVSWIQMLEWHWLTIGHIIMDKEYEFCELCGYLYPVYVEIMTVTDCHRRDWTVKTANVKTK